MFKIIIGLFIYFSISYDSYSQEISKDKIKHVINSESITIILSDNHVNEINVEIKNDKHSFLLNCTKVENNEFYCRKPMVISQNDSINLYLKKEDSTSYDMVHLKL